MVRRVTSSVVECYVQRKDEETDVLIAGYEVTRFGVPMIGEYENTGRGRRVTINHAVPGAQYRITAWATGDHNRSATPAVMYATTGEARDCDMYFLMCVVEYSLQQCMPVTCKYSVILLHSLYTVQSMHRKNNCYVGS